MPVNRPERSETGDPLPQIIAERSACILAIRTLVEHANRELCLLNHALDARIYGGDLAEAVKRFLLSSQRARLQVLVADPGLAAAQGATGLIELGRRLSSRVEFRELPSHAVPLEQGEWLIADSRALLERSLQTGSPAHYWPLAPQRARRRRDSFASLWEISVPAAALRALHL